MSSGPVTRVIVIKNKQGLHARPAELFSRTARSFQSKIELVREGYRIDASSIINLLTLGATQGTELTLEAEGPDAEEAVAVLAALVEHGFVLDEAGEEKKTPENKPIKSNQD